MSVLTYSCSVNGHHRVCVFPLRHLLVHTPFRCLPLSWAGILVSPYRKNWPPAILLDQRVNVIIEHQLLYSWKTWKTYLTNILYFISSSPSMSWLTAWLCFSRRGFLLRSEGFLIASDSGHLATTASTVSEKRISKELTPVLHSEIGRKD